MFFRLLIVEPAVQHFSLLCIFTLLVSERMSLISHVPAGTGTESVQNASCN